MRPSAHNDEATPTRGRSKNLSPAVQARIGQGLKAIFDEVAREPVPDDLLRLLKKLESQDRKGPK